MKIILATPLFPPDIGGAAPYCKELAARLAKYHNVTIVTYGKLPEHILGVSFISVDKQRPLLLRLAQYIFTLWREAGNADIVYAENGASVELPVGIVALFRRTPVIFHIGDKPAHTRAAAHPLHRSIEHFAFTRASETVTDIPLERPEVLPFEPTVPKTVEAYDISWKTHLRMLEDSFKKYAQYR